MFLSILLFPEWIIVPAFGIGFVYGIYLVAKAFNFKRADNLLEVDGTLTQFNSTRLNFIAVINRYEYEYYVDGNKFQGKESESFLFKQQRPSTMPTQVKVTCVKNKPHLSRLNFINHERCVLKGVAAVLVCALAIFFYAFAKFYF